MTFCVAICGLLAGCVTTQSALHPGSGDARAVRDLFYAMTAAGALLWLAVMGLALYAVLGQRRAVSPRFADRFILICGVILPTFLLFALMAFGLRLLPDWRSTQPADLQIEITGEQFWWRVTYTTAAGQRFETANQLRLPAGQQAELILSAQDVIHSLWVPPLGGKLDMIPGRTNRLRVTPDQPGRYRGVCAEFCGSSHALMAFDAEVMPADAFTNWLDQQAAETRVTPAQEPGLQAFRRAGCGACHRIRGLSGEGSVGPDLTHLAQRTRLGADLFPNNRAALRQWLLAPQSLKPGARMPGYADLPPADLEAILDLLETL